jgi:hypothetical protein
VRSRDNQIGTGTQRDHFEAGLNWPSGWRSRLFQVFPMARLPNLTVSAGALRYSIGECAWSLVSIRFIAATRHRSFSFDPTRSCRAMKD